ncbi:MAG TPA: HAD family phosphatase [Bryobacteraceae bacterium]|nr:HAD family phosphatase [Bryobacteraceae bacterium]
MVRTIIFDMGRVIIPFDFQFAYDRLSPLCNIEAGTIKERMWACDLPYRLESGKITPEEFRAGICKLLSFSCEEHEFHDIFGSIFLPETLLNKEFLQALRSRYRLLLLSNTNAIHWPFVQKHYPELQHFDQHILSFEVGATKPEPEIYAAALNAANCEPSECFFTDDIPAYVEAARTHGIDAVVFENAEQIQRELRARGVDW